MNFLKISKAVIFLALSQSFFCNSGIAQTTPPSYSLIDNLNPVTPTMRQFTKYTDLPVSEYTGVADISIPLYEIDEDGIKIPLSLTYHSGGIRVNEEASWVGLGWDMTIGSIVQTINDQDDYVAKTFVQPDFINTTGFYLYPAKYEWYLPPSGSGDDICNPGEGCNGLIAIPPLSINCGMVVYTAEYAPFQGDYGYQKPQNYKNFFFNHRTDYGYSVDSEPDIFTANFLGYSFKFLKDPVTQAIVLLDKQGFQVTRVSPTEWKVLVPSGDEYDFGVEDVITTGSSGVTFAGEEATSDPLPSSNVWMLTQIITKNKKVITFNYTQTATQNCYPSATQRGIIATKTGSLYTGNTADWVYFAQSCDVNSGGCGTGVYSNVTSSTEKYTYLSSITFPKGTVNFSLSARNDVQGGLKLDGLSISSNTQVLKSYQFNYSYFDASNVGGNTFNFGTSYGNYPLYRLELLSLVDNGGATHTFTYNSIQLPAKNSFAIDYWGYYNGDISNTSYVPNATQFNQTGYTVNSDNHSANLTYTQACMLQQIKYPTSGTVNFTYALNQFNNYLVPNYSSNTNTTSSGDGLRIQAVTWNDINGNQLKQSLYSYSMGTASIPLVFFRSYNYNISPPGDLTPPNSYYIENMYSINETNMSGCFTSNPFASFNGVGYSQVTKTDVDNNGNTNGKTVSNYYNLPDLVYSQVQQANQIDPTMPAYKNPSDSAENGSLKSELYYNNSNVLLKKVTNSYVKYTSPEYYGARIMGYANLVRYIEDGQDVYQQNIITQSAVAYYPIYDFETLPSSTTETDYFGSDNLTYTTNNTYDQYHQISYSVKSNATSVSEETAFTYPYDYPTTSILETMTSQNRLSDIVTAATGSYGGSETNLARSYQQVGNLIVASNDATNEHYGSPPDITTYDQYDPTNGNIWQYSKNGLPTSLIWDYNKEYVIADVKNALITNVAYTSFEADGNGRWTFSGTPVTDSQAPTGSKAYLLTTGNISCSGLDATQTYIVSYWSKNGAQTVSGSSSVKQGYTFNGYTYFEHTVVSPSGGSITVSGNAEIDELRLYPNTAQMTSYTYQPLVGITSASSAAGKISYYQYDSSQRLINIIDQYGNILKHMSYHYVGQ